MSRQKMTVTFQGGDEFVRRMRSFGPEYINKVVGKALTASGTPLLKEATRTAPVNSGRLEATLVKVTRKNKKTKVPYLSIGAALLGKEITFKSGIKRRHRFAKKFKRLGLTSDAYYIKFVNFGSRFQAPQPFLTAATFAKGQEAVSEYARVSAAEVDKL